MQTTIYPLYQLSVKTIKTKTFSIIYNNLIKTLKNSLNT